MRMRLPIPDARNLAPAHRQRLEIGLSQERLAHIAGLPRAYVGQIEIGHRNVGLTNLAKLARALDVGLGTLLDGLEEYASVE